MHLLRFTLFALSASFIQSAAVAPAPLCPGTRTYNQRLMCCANLIEPRNVLTLTRNPLPIVDIVNLLLLGFAGIGMGTQCSPANRPSDCQRAEKSVCCGNIALLVSISYTSGGFEGEGIKAR